jgi:hypothetical protein
LFPKTHIVIDGKQRRCIGVCASDDDPEVPPFTKFYDRQLAIAPDALDDDMAEDRLAAAKPILLHDHPDDHHCEFYGMFVFRCGDMFLGLLWAYDPSFELSRIGGSNQYAIVEVQLAASRDLFHWKRVGGRLPVIPTGSHGAFDSHMIFYHSLPVEVEDEWWIYYMGFNEGHAARLGYTEELRQKYWDDVKAGKRFLPSIGLGKVRKEGFLSLDAGNSGGQIVTRPVVPGGSRLYLNAAVAASGSLAVELQDSSGKALPGFEAAACQPLNGDGVRLRVDWKGNPDRSGLTRQPVRLAILSQNASIYGFTFQ